MKTAKQEAIEKAYGEHWDIVWKHVDEDGYLHHPKGGEVTFEPFIGFMDEHPTKDAYRPKSLSGLETNNGWISILSEYDLPKESGKYFIIKDESIDIGTFNFDYKKWISSGQYYFDTTQNIKITHYQPIKRPFHPIY